jgi:hypothetical protein
VTARAPVRVVALVALGWVLALSACSGEDDRDAPDGAGPTGDTIGAEEHDCIEILEGGGSIEDCQG